MRPSAARRGNARPPDRASRPAAGPDPGLADRAREEFDYLVKVRAEYPRLESSEESRTGRSLDELYALYYEAQENVAPDAELMATFRAVREEAGYSSP